MSKDFLEDMRASGIKVMSMAECSQSVLDEIDVSSGAKRVMNKRNTSTAARTQSRSPTVGYSHADGFNDIGMVTPKDVALSFDANDTHLRSSRQSWVDPRNPPLPGFHSHSMSSHDTSSKSGMNSAFEVGRSSSGSAFRGASVDYERMSDGSMEDLEHFANQFHE
jgi:hypothetical protein